VGERGREVQKGSEGVQKVQKVQKVQGAEAFKVKKGSQVQNRSASFFHPEKRRSRKKF
jgi:hypothetical protein